MIKMPNYNYVAIFADNFRNYDVLEQWTDVDVDVVGSLNNELHLEASAAAHYIRAQLPRKLSNFICEVDLKINYMEAASGALFALGDAEAIQTAANTVVTILKSAASTFQVKDENQTNEIGTVTITEGTTWIRFKIFQSFFGKTNSTGLVQVWYKNLTTNGDWTYIGSRSTQATAIKYIGLGGLGAATYIIAKNLVIQEVFPHEIKDNGL